MKSFFCRRHNAVGHPSFGVFIFLLVIFFSLSHAVAADSKVGSPGLPPSGETSELWTGALYTSTYRVGLCVSATGSVRGALFLSRADGQVDEYHFTGSVNNNHIEAHHSSGHQFSGRLVSREHVEGRISLKNGMKIFLEGKRIQDAPLNYDDCSPLTDSAKQ